MSFVAVRWFSAGATALAGVLLLTSCAVGPNFRVPAAPDVSRFTKEPLAPRTSSTDTPTGQMQRFVQSRDVPQEWWTLFRSPALNALIEQALSNNPTLQSALSTLRASKEAVYAQQGKFFPLVQANFNPTRQQTAAALAPVPASGASIYDLYTAQVQVSYTFDVLGSQSAHGRIASGAGRHAALPGRGGLPHSHVQPDGRSDHRRLAARTDRGDQ